MTVREALHDILGGDVAVSLLADMPVLWVCFAACNHITATGLDTPTTEAFLAHLRAKGYQGRDARSLAIELGEEALVEDACCEISPETLAGLRTLSEWTKPKAKTDGG